MNKVADQKQERGSATVTTGEGQVRREGARPARAYEKPILEYLEQWQITTGFAISGGG